MAGPALEEGRLIDVPPDRAITPFSAPEAARSAVYPSNRNILRLVRLFVDHCVETIETGGPARGQVRHLKNGSENVKGFR